MKSSLPSEYFTNLLFVDVLQKNSRLHLLTLLFPKIRGFLVVYAPESYLPQIE